MSTQAEAPAEGGGHVVEPASVQSGAEVEASGAPDLPAPGEGTDADDGGDLPVLRSGRIVDVIADAITFTLVIARLAIAAVAMRMLSQAVKGAYSYVEGCAKQVDHLADVAATLAVDDAVTSAHHDAAGVMRESLALADALAEEAAEMSTEFDNAARDHDSDYGTVNEAMQSGPYDVAEREWYSNR
ncbi:hypothetical protein [Streptomyces viridochromogenes]|uniref:hypothetical protein n=1 Tax=Streptomyces viridochromogenes TaxID=1938 RepID=UPI00069D019E|nr:hypothetical protein [Streptomyces viridochromogenes]